MIPTLLIAHVPRTQTWANGLGAGGSWWLQNNRCKYILAVNIQFWQIIDIHCLSRMQLGHIFSSASFCDLMLSVAASAFAVFSSVQPSSPSHPYVAKATRMHQSERSWICIEYNKNKNFIHLNLYHLPLAVTAALCQFSFPGYLSQFAWVPRPIFQTSPFFQAIAMENAVTSHENGAASEIKGKGARVDQDLL